MRATHLLAATLIIGTSIAQQTNPTFQSSAREVLLEVIVRDAHGKLVTKIDPSLVSVYEDGVRQDIKSFRLVPGREVRAEVEKEIALAATKPGALQFDAAHLRPPSNPLRTVNIVCLILNDLSPETRQFAFDAARKFVNKELRPDTFIGVFSLDASGLRPVFPFSNNRDRLVKAIELAAVNQLPTLSQSNAAILNGLSMSTLGVSAVGAAGLAPNGVAIVDAPPVGVPTGADGSNAQDPLGTRGDMGVAINAGLREIDALIGLMKQLGQLPFHKTVLLMGTGLTRPPDQLEYWQSLINLANKGGVTFYAVDVYGLGVCQDSPDCSQGSTNAQGGSGAITGSPVSTPSSTAGAMLNATAAMSRAQVSRGSKSTAQTMELAHQTDYLRYGVLSANTQEALREIAESTGGFLIANTNNTEALLTKVMEDVDTHYELAYRPASAGSDGHFRKIEIKIARADVRVQTRSGYFAVPETGEGPLTPGDFGALQALDSNPLPHAFDFESKAFRFRSEKGTSQYAIAFEVRISNLTATAEASEKKHKYHAYLLALVKNSEGEIVERVSKDVSSDVADEYLPGLRSEAVTYEHAVNLSPGHYTIESVVVDREGNRASTHVQEIENREQTGPGLSDITLVRRVESLDRAPDAADPFEIPGKRAQPFLFTTLAAGTQPSLYFVAYPDGHNSDVPSMRAQFMKDGRLLANQKTALPQPDASGSVPMTIQPAAGPGEYEVRITIEQGSHAVQRSLKYTIVK
jgi:VWFA-related protein